MSDTCRGCIFYKVRDREYGLCRRNPPNSAEEDWWPHTHKDYWCGEFKPLSTGGEISPGANLDSGPKLK